MIAAVLIIVSTLCSIAKQTSTTGTDGKQDPSSKPEFNSFIDKVIVQAGLSDISNIDSLHTIHDVLSGRLRQPTSPSHFAFDYDCEDDEAASDANASGLVIHQYNVESLDPNGDHNKHFEANFTVACHRDTGTIAHMEAMVRRRVDGEHYIYIPVSTDCASAT